MEILGLSRRAEVFLGLHPLFTQVKEAKIWWDGRAEISDAADVFENTIVSEDVCDRFSENGCAYELSRYVLADGRVLLEVAVRCIAPDGSEVIVILLQDAATKEIIPESVPKRYRIAKHAAIAV